MEHKRSATAVRKRLNPAARWGRYLMAGALLLAVLVASGISAQLSATSDTPHGSSLEDADSTLYAYGDRRRPLVEETGGAQTLNIYGPGGQIIAQVVADALGGSQKAPHLLADHLGSTRAILDADDNVVARFEYGPHGETAAASGTGTAAELPYRYTGHAYDEEQRLYQTPARGYDPTTGRFLSTDPEQGGANSYSYSGNDPINSMDPDGEAPIHFLLYSRYGVETLDYPGIASIRGNVEGLYNLSRTMSSTLVVAAMDGNMRVGIPPDPIQNSHMTIIAHGLPDQLSVINPHTGALATITGAEFPRFLRSGLVRIFGNDAHLVARGTRSMSILSCHGACRIPNAPGYPENSFAEQFARVARPYFPNLEDVVASPYEIHSARGRHAAHQNEIELGVYRRENGHPEILGRHMDMENFVSGQYPDSLFGRVWDAGFDTLTQTFHTPTSHGVTSREMQTDWPSDIGYHIYTHVQDYLEPVLRRTPVLPPPAIPEE